MLPINTGLKTNKKKFFKGIQAVRIEFLFLLKVANIRCFILIAVEILRIWIRLPLHKLFSSKMKNN